MAHLTPPFSPREVPQAPLRELALAISLVSLGSSQTFFLPQRRTLEASLFCSRSILQESGGVAQRPEGPPSLPRDPQAPLETHQSPLNPMSPPPRNPCVPLKYP